MTETPNQERPNPEPEPNAVKTENLRDYTKLRRTSYDRKIAGVAGGLGRHLNIDPVIVRVLFVVLCFFGGAGFILYGAAWLLVPEDTGKPAHWKTTDSTRNILLIIAAVFAGLLLVGDSWGGFGFPWPLALVALILFGVLMSRDNAPVSTPPTGTPDAPAPYAAPQPGAAYAGGDQAVPIGQPYHYAGSQVGWQPVTPQTPPKPKKPGPILFGITLALIAVGLGALGLYDALADNNVADAAYPALALAITGAMLVVGSFFGRPGGLILLGLVASMALAGASIADPRFSGERDLYHTPESASEVQNSYHVPAGKIVLDLTEVSEPAALEGRTIDLEANAAEIVVILPDGLAADVDADIAIAGAITLPDGEVGGLSQSRQEFIGSTNDPTVELNIDLKLGHIEVRQES